MPYGVVSMLLKMTLHKERLHNTNYVNIDHFRPNVFRVCVRLHVTMQMRLHIQENRPYES
jgi:hypothetical protein